MDGQLAAARAYLADQYAFQERQAAEFEVTLPTPNTDECDRANAGEIVMLKEWDLSPVDPASFDPTEPPGRPVPDPPVNTVPPAVTGTPDVGQTLTVSTGTWTGAQTYAYAWQRDGAAIAGATTATHLLAAADLAALIGCQVTGTGGGGSAPALSNTVGPIVDPGGVVEDVDTEGAPRPARSRQRRTT